MIKSNVSKWNLNVGGKYNFKKLNFISHCEKETQLHVINNYYSHKYANMREYKKIYSQRNLR